ncbi:LuxR C-terminal-related transcriptional regulator [Parvibaculum sp.]|uniref:helix-turn-helix transcriptional regulator n=1 Tax=Parvibaculum sp. TaxID=2024848 RepID=UPI0032979DC9
MAAGRLKSKRKSAPGLDQAALQAAALALCHAATLPAAEAALGEIASLIAMPRAIWTSDVASPLYDPAAEAFLRRQGWPPEIVAALWEGGIALRMPLNIRCRFEHMPFAISLYDDHRRHRRPYSGEQKQVAGMMRGQGFNSVLVVPVRLPLARVAMLGFAGPQPLEEVEAIIEAAAPQLLFAGHVFTALQDRLAKRSRPREEDSAALTPRERDCLSLAAQGLREAEIAERNGIKPTTVRYHLDNAVAKLGARTRAHAVAIAAQLGLVGTRE